VLDRRVFLKQNERGGDGGTKRGHSKAQKPGRIVEPAEGGDLGGVEEREKQNLVGEKILPKKNIFLEAPGRRSSREKKLSRHCKTEHKRKGERKLKNEGGKAPITG